MDYFLEIRKQVGLFKEGGFSVVLSRRAGRSIYYRIASPKIIRACDLMRDVLMERINNERWLWSEFKKSGGWR